MYACVCMRPHIVRYIYIHNSESLLFEFISFSEFLNSWVNVTALWFGRFKSYLNRNEGLYFLLKLNDNRPENSQYCMYIYIYIVRYWSACVFVYMQGSNFKCLCVCFVSGHTLYIRTRDMIWVKGGFIYYDMKSANIIIWFGKLCLYIVFLQNLLGDFVSFYDMIIIWICSSEQFVKNL